MAVKILFPIYIVYAGWYAAIIWSDISGVQLIGVAMFSRGILWFLSRYGVVYHGLKEDQMVVTFKGQVRKYKQLHILDFDSNRKRMSTIVENEQGKASCCQIS